MFDKLVNIATMLAVGSPQNICCTALVQMWTSDMKDVKLSVGANRRPVHWRKLVDDPDVVETHVFGIDTLFVTFEGKQYEWQRNATRDTLVYVGCIDIQEALAA